MDGRTKSIFDSILENEEKRKINFAYTKGIIILAVIAIIVPIMLYVSTKNTAKSKAKEELRSQVELITKMTFENNNEKFDMETKRNKNIYLDLSLEGNLTEEDKKDLEARLNKAKENIKILDEMKVNAELDKYKTYIRSNINFERIQLEEIIAPKEDKNYIKSLFNGQQEIINNNKKTIESELDRINKKYKFNFKSPYLM